MTVLVHSVCSYQSRCATLLLKPAIQEDCILLLHPEGRIKPCLNITDVLKLELNLKITYLSDQQEVFSA